MNTNDNIATIMRMKLHWSLFNDTPSCVKYQAIKNTLQRDLDKQVGWFLHKHLDGGLRQV